MEDMGVIFCVCNMYFIGHFCNYKYVWHFFIFINFSFYRFMLWTLNHNITIQGTIFSLYQLSIQILMYVTSSLLNVTYACGKIHWLNRQLNLPFLFAAGPFWTFHNKSDNMKALVILSHSWSQFLLPTCLYGKYELVWVSVQPSGVFSHEKNTSQITHANHMIMTTIGQI